jgi:hypothetical protein
MLAAYATHVPWGSCLVNPWLALLVAGSDNERFTARII